MDQSHHDHGSWLNSSAFTLLSSFRKETRLYVNFHCQFWRWQKISGSFIKYVFGSISFMMISPSSPVLQSRSQSNIPPPPPPQLSASDSDPNLTGIPSSWSACWALLSAQTLGAAPTLAQACLDYLHPHWCNPVLNCAAHRMYICPSHCGFFNLSFFVQEKFLRKMVVFK